MDGNRHRPTLHERRQMLNIGETSNVRWTYRCYSDGAATMMVALQLATLRCNHGDVAALQFATLCCNATVCCNSRRYEKAIFFFLPHVCLLSPQRLP
jgi:hypothetical protein